MKHVTVALAVLLLAASCSRGSTATPVPTPTATVAPLPTAIPVRATPPPGPTIVRRAYMRLVHERVLVEYARRTEQNRELLGSASTRGLDADIICPRPEGGSWQHFGDLGLELSVIPPPPQAAELHQALSEALAAAEKSAESYEWFCQTYTTFGQPAEGIWQRLSIQVRACQTRMDDLHAQWAALGGNEIGLVW